VDVIPLRPHDQTEVPYTQSCGLNSFYGRNR
jgi:hypothetical protein